MLNWQAFRGPNLRQRLISSLVLAPVTLFLVYAGGLAYAGAVAMVTLLGLREWLRLINGNAAPKIIYVSYVFLLLILAIGSLFSVPLGALLGIILVLVLFLIAVRDHEEQAGWITLGFPYMASFGLALLDLRITPIIGMAQLYYLLAVVWGTDIGAYLVGRLIGGPKMAPSISPNKTWAGLLGGMVLAAFCGYAVTCGVKAHYPWVAAGFAFVMAGVSQMGDLFESYIKRRSGHKESGGIIPGHGGILDRVDGLIFAAVFYVLYQASIGQTWQWW